jgi:DNA-binding MurR/RpiR family transcriptional regulator
MTRAETRSEQAEPNGTDGAPPPQRSPSDIIALILDREPTLSRTNRKLAHAILTEPRAFVEKPIEELIGWVGVSAPTIARFARSLDCEGLRDLKLKVMGSMRVGMRYLEPPTPPAAVEEVADRVTKRAQRAISNAAHDLDLAAVETAIAAISDCRTLYAFGSGGVSSWLVEEIQNRFFRLGVRVVPSSDPQMQMMLAATAERGDLLLCASLGGVNPELVRAMAIAHEYGARTIALARPGSPVSEGADIRVGVAAADDGDVLGPTSMRYAYLIAIDVLAYGTAVRRQPTAREKLRRIKQQFTTFRDSDETQPLCD